MIKIKVDGSTLSVRDADERQYMAIRNCNGMRWDPKEKALVGIAGFDTLETLQRVLKSDGLRLPGDAMKLWQALSARKAAVDRERARETPEPLVRYPVKMPMYEHQVRSANMALIAFGWVPPEASR